MDPNIIHSDYPEVEPPVCENVARFFLGYTHHRLEDTFIICGTTGTRYTRGNVLEQATCFSRSLLRHSNFGIRNGDVVGILLPNCGEYFPIVLGLISRGIIPSCFNPTFTIDEITDLVEEVGAKALICLPSAPQGLDNLLKIPCVDQLILVGESAHEGEKYEENGMNCIRNYFELVEEGIKDVKDTAEEFIGQGDDTATIFWSSGTSGKPKGVELTHTNLICAVMAYSSMNDWKSEDIILHPLPFFHIYGFICTLMTVFNLGCKSVSVQKFSPDIFIKSLREYHPTILCLVPPLLNFLASSDKVTREDFASVRSVRCGAAPCGNTLIDSFDRKTGGHIIFGEGYGLTESSAVGFFMPSNLPQVLTSGSVGTVSSGVQAKVIDVDTRESVGGGVVGEICLRSRTVMKGFYKRPDATSLMIDSEGWLHTGDLGYFTAENKLFYISGRSKDIIKVKGFQVCPEEIEEVGRKLSGVKDIAVVGIHHPIHGEVPKAYVVRQNADLTADAVQDFIRDKMAHYKQLKGGVDFLETIPRNTSGKILRRLLAQ